MEKTLLALDPTQADTRALDFASYLGAITNSKITGVFLGSPDADDKLVPGELVCEDSHSLLKPDSGHKDFLRIKEATKKNVAFFNEACERRSARHSLHIATGDPVKEIIAKAGTQIYWL